MACGHDPVAKPAPLGTLRPGAKEVDSYADYFRTIRSAVVVCVFTMGYELIGFFDELLAPLTDPVLKLSPVAFT
jgi:hypothetical protein